MKFQMPETGNSTYVMVELKSRIFM